MHPRRMEEYEKGCPFAHDSELLFPPRHAGMSLDNITKDDVPHGPRKFCKDIDFSLTTSDIPMSRPMLAHPMSGSGVPLPWKCIRRRPEDTPEIEKSRVKTHYPPVDPARPRDLSLTTSDIEFARPPKRSDVNSEGRNRAEPVDPLCATYAMPSSEAPPPPTARASGKCTLDVTDIKGAVPKLQIPFRREYGDTLKCEDDFRSRNHQRAFAAAARAALNEDSSEARQLTPRGPCGTAAWGTVDESFEARQCAPRSTNPLEPRYNVPVSRDTSLHATWSEERGQPTSHKSPAHYEEIGDIKGSTARARLRYIGVPLFSL
jgi:hypothetical protein